MKNLLNTINDTFDRTDEVLAQMNIKFPHVSGWINRCKVYYKDLKDNTPLWAIPFKLCFDLLDTVVYHAWALLGMMLSYIIIFC